MMFFNPLISLPPRNGLEPPTGGLFPPLGGFYQNAVKEPFDSAFFYFYLQSHCMCSGRTLVMPDEFPWTFETFCCLSEVVIRIVMLSQSSDGIRRGPAIISAG